MEDYVQDVIHVIYMDNIQLVDVLQESHRKICQIIDSWSDSTMQLTMLDESLWPFTFAEYDDKQKLVLFTLLPS